MTETRICYRVDLLGPLHVERNGHRLEPGPAKQRAVLALLALRLGDSVPVGEVEEAVWGAVVPPSARSLVHTYVARLRQVLEPEYPPRRRVRVIASTVSGYSLRAETAETDVARFRRYVSQAEKRIGEGDREGAFDLLGQALNLWRSPNIGELRSLLHDNIEVEALSAAWVATAHTYVGLGLRLGRSAAVLDTATRLARLEPLHEAIQADYLAVLGSSGHRTVALHRYAEVDQRLRTELGVDPGEELRAVHRVLVRPPGRPPVPRPAPVIPAARRRAARVSIAGRLRWRAEEVADLVRLLAKHRAVTVAGAPGCGKSAVALRAAQQAARVFTGGTLMVNTLDLRDRRQLERRLARMLGGDGAEDPVELLSGRPTLLVLDNAEHMVDACAVVADRLLVACPGVAVLTSSRQSLGLPYERVQRLHPLPVPQPGGWPSVLSNPAVALLAERATQVRPGFRLDRRDAEVAVEICRRLDGLPLALEMAAACLSTESLDGVLRKLNGPLEELRPPGSSELRHPSLRAMLDRSVQRLDVIERCLFHRIALLPGVFDLAAVQRSWQPHPSGPIDVRVVLAALVDKSLVMPVGQTGGRYRMLGLLRRMAVEVSIAEATPRPAPEVSVPLVRPLLAAGKAGALE
ncbi:BTAD domain-containing putative transcriptional regulator [Verrucosispora sp. WMMD573]|uniref:ATP-binding protein n=1 Tax=Verrucosispora sp. WMMD573 TaxID=3015149 RepID=UPI00248BCBD6|nr:BTAD domain-containing putative transcriptional regulator [Verrucosispora sp. WMMD573]WBB53764.1 BTAD domain-containing putative transcriptional regulator [Verrucosispora sp. WMMD573]